MNRSWGPMLLSLAILAWGLASTGARADVHRPLGVLLFRGNGRAGGEAARDSTK